MNKENWKYLDAFSKGVIAASYQLWLKGEGNQYLTSSLTNAVEVCMHEAIIVADRENTDDT